jgi:zinc D-Ala-D-Ala carboxypeptidase
MRKKLFYAGVVMVALALTAWLTLYKPGPKAGAPSPDAQTEIQLDAGNPANKSAGSDFNKQLHSIDEPGSIWWIVNKVRPLNPATYAPTDLVTPNVPLRHTAGDSEMRLRKEAATALEELITAAKQEQINLLLASGYRSYQLQVAVYNANVQKYGQAGADKQSARPGTSEHQTGLAADIGSVSRKCEIEQCFGNMPEGQWLASNAYKYGFVMRYPENKEAATGYEYEPWHYRYVGKELSAELNKQGTLTLEEFFGIVPARQPY